VAAELPLDLDEVEVPDELSLVVGWKVGNRGNLEGGEVRTGAPVKRHLAEACERTLERIAEATMVPYTADLRLERDECLAVVDSALVEASPLTPIVLPQEPLGVLGAPDLPRRSLLFSAVTISTEQGDLAFVRKANPRPSARGGKILALLGNVLKRIEEPVFALEESFDMIVMDGAVVSLHQGDFELLFWDADLLQAAIPGWIDDVASHLPIEREGADRLKELAITDGRVRKRLRAISERGHLANVSLDQVRSYVNNLGFDEKDFVANGELIIDPSDPFKMLYVLNEDLFKGGLTATPFRSEGKRPG